MTEPEPLSISVARAIGWTDIEETSPGVWRGRFAGTPSRIPAYDRSWCAIGPWVDRLKIELSGPWCLATWRRPRESGLIAFLDGPHDVFEQGQTAPEAVCRLLVAMSAAGIDLNPPNRRLNTSLFEDF